MGYLLGYLLAWVIFTLGVMFVLAVLWEWVLFKWVLEDPLHRELISIGAALATSIALGASTGTYSGRALIEGLVAALALALIAHWRDQRRQMQSASEDVTETLE